MSADPEAPAHPGRLSGGHIVRNMIYSHDENGGLEVVTGWKDEGVREHNQDVVRPGRMDLHAGHPCYAMNRSLVECSLKCPPEMKLAGRTAVCNAQRQDLMKCLVKHKKWTPPATKPWYQFW
ncbi:hypothetical protein AGDE_00090 [Angomonas deanei]|uniref:Uncharacterized protein n=1 Tax=Angomonas deanei TaxID=59799 RepID=S9VHQ6_9TRYP|nr:hypothetical protein AGDE_03768 [Angomonas deanei]EPY40394.1 hypothetical protein AGDE_03534 [Angomonas deanei]EPY43831.1 hypothetical protein AGDE_00090 [Angomonas deanei]CAD2213827.1 hypothetical protein, conserved [Angomonas deanei]|eukprot:EPY40160.1 hypothetical protein AGDE_03768 [Angomonas deanei]